MKLKSIFRVASLIVGLILFSLFTLHATFASTVVSSWSLNQNAQDSIGTNNGTVNGNVIFVNDYAQFDGTSYITTSTNNLPGGNTPRTIEFDFNTTYGGSDQSDFFSYGTPSSNEGISTGVINGGKLFLSTWGPAIFTTHTFNDGNWHHAKMQIFADGTASILIDGVNEATGALNPNTVVTSASYIGKLFPNQSSSFFYQGLLKNLSITNDSITTTPTPTPTPSNTLLYVSNDKDNAVGVIDSVTHNKIATIPVGNEPRAIVYDSLNNRVYVGNTYSNTVSVIDPTTNTVVATIPLGNTITPLTFALSHDKTRLYAANFGGTQISVIDTTTNTLLTTLTGFSNPQGMVLSSDDSKLYVANQNCCSTNGYVSVVDTNSYSTIATIQVNHIGPVRITLTPDNKKAYVSIDGGPNYSHYVTVIDTTTNTVMKDIPIGNDPSEIVTNSTGTRVYVASTYYWFGGSTLTTNGIISVIDTSTDTVLTTIPVGHVPNEFTISADDSKLYVVNNLDNSISVVDTLTNLIVDTISNVGNSIDTDPWSVAIVGSNITVPSVSVSSLTNNCGGTAPCYKLTVTSSNLAMLMGGNPHNCSQSENLLLNAVNANGTNTLVGFAQPYATSMDFEWDVLSAGNNGVGIVGLQVQTGSGCTSGNWLYGNGTSSYTPALFYNTVGTTPTPSSSLQIVPASTFTGTALCKPGYSSPQCLAQPFDITNDLAYQGNGYAKPAVAFDVISGYDAIHAPQYVNDGFYGNGASWISNSTNSWVKIDLGRVVDVNALQFGRDRTGNYDDRDPGQFKIFVATADDVYANGNDSNDATEYTQVFDSSNFGFSGIVSGPQTVRANFPTVQARYIKLQVANLGTDVDEVEVLNTAATVTSTPTPTPTPTPIPTPTPYADLIAYYSNRSTTGTGSEEIRIMNSDGSNMHQITSSPGDDFAPSWSPDGKQLVFGSNRDGNYEVYVMNPDGSNQHNLTNNPSNDWPGKWSPDGSKIVFYSDRSGTKQIYVMNADGTNVQRLTNDSANDYIPTWSPDGKYITFSSDAIPGIQIMQADGTNRHQLTDIQGDYYAVWSPDGTKIAFNRKPSSTEDYEIYVMNSDGTNPVDITNNPAQDRDATWSPDGSQIIFNSFRSGEFYFYKVNADGSNIVQITSTNGSGASWRPNPNIIPPTPLGSWSLTGSLSQVRRGFDATTLPNGKVLVAGGVDVPGNFLSTTELYDPATGTWSLTGNLNTPRIIPLGDLVVLGNGKVLMPTGEGPNLLALPSTELYDPNTGTWSYTGSLNVGRRGPSVVKLLDGRVMVIAGEHNAPDANQFIGSSEFYDQSTDTWTMSTSTLQVARGFGQVATLLHDGRVLIGGGEGPWLTVGTQAEIYNPSTDTWSSAGNMPYAWQGAATIVLPSGKVLVAGGFDIYPIPGVQNTTNAALNKAAIYDPVTNTWSATTPMPSVRSNGRFFLLSDGRALLAGGNDGTQYDGKDFIYDPATATWTVGSNMVIPRGSVVLSALRDGRQLAIGGIDTSGNFLASAELYSTASVNHPPTANAGGTYTVDEGGLVQLSGSGTDPDNDPLTYQWDLNNDGTYDIVGQNAVYSAIDGPSTQQVTLQVCDNHGACTTDSATIIVNNVAPTIGNISLPSSRPNPGTSVAVSATFTDPGILDTHTAMWDFGDGSVQQNGTVTETNGSGSVSGSHVYMQGGTYTITVTVTDKDGGSTSKSTQILINHPPVANAGGIYQANEGDMVLLTGSGTDSDGDTLTYKWDLNNDGVYDVTGQQAVFSAVDGPSIEHATLQVCDSRNACTTDTATININNVAPTITSLNIPQTPFAVGTSMAVNATYTDPGILDTHTAVWDWGDGNTQQAAISESNGSGTASGNHSYTAAGVYTVGVKVTDKDGGSVMQQYQYVVVYDPNAGFISGSGQITSPVGADVALPNATGKAKFGVQAKYVGTNTRPTGNTKFSFKNGSIDFSSLYYDWLVVSGNKAYLHGTGTVNGTGSYNFLVTAIDSNPDTFRMKIKDNATGSVIYDNQMNASDFTDPTEAIDSGQIQVH